MSSNKRRKISSEDLDQLNSLDIFPTTRTKLSGSSFKTMGLPGSRNILLIARFWTYSAEVYCAKGLQKPDSHSAENNSSNHSGP